MPVKISATEQEETDPGDNNQPANDNFQRPNTTIVWISRHIELSRRVDEGDGDPLKGVTKSLHRQRSQELP